MEQTRRQLLFNLFATPIALAAGIKQYPERGNAHPTMAMKPSAFDRINVRRLFIAQRIFLLDELKGWLGCRIGEVLFECNDKATRDRTLAVVEPRLAQLKKMGAFTDYVAVCDETNNTAQVINDHSFELDIYLQFSPDTNFLQLNMRAKRTDLDCVGSGELTEIAV